MRMFAVNGKYDKLLTLVKKRKPGFGLFVEIVPRASHVPSKTGWNSKIMYAHSVFGNISHDKKSVVSGEQCRNFMVILFIKVPPRIVCN